MKKEYTPAELEIILFNQDIITTSGGGAPGIDDDDPATGNGGSGIGGGYNPGGWT